jgi:hypothetical protein
MALHHMSSPRIGLMPTFFFPLKPNAGPEPRPELGRDKARYITARFLIPPV